MLFDYTTPQGEWQYHYTLPSWKGLRLLGFEAGSGLDNEDEILDALEVNAPAMWRRLSPSPLGTLLV